MAFIAIGGVTRTASDDRPPGSRTEATATASRPGLVHGVAQDRRDAGPARRRAGASGPGHRPQEVRRPDHLDPHAPRGVRRDSGQGDRPPRRPGEARCLGELRARRHEGSVRLASRLGDWQPTVPARARGTSHEQLPPGQAGPDGVYANGNAQRRLVLPPRRSPGHRPSRATPFPVSPRRGDRDRLEVQDLRARGHHGPRRPPPPRSTRTRFNACWTMSHSDGVENTYEWPQTYGCDQPKCEETVEYQYDTYWIRDEADEATLASIKANGMTGPESDELARAARLLQQGRLGCRALPARQDRGHSERHRRSGRLRRRPVRHDHRGRH